MKAHGLLRRPALTVLSIFMLAALACGGGSDPVPELFGTWEWVGTSGEITGDSRTPHPDDPAITVRFAPGGTAVFSRDGEVARELTLSDNVYDGFALQYRRVTE